jgi:hypothetical protein
MNTGWASLSVVIFVVLLASEGTALADSFRVGWSSQQVSPRRAKIGAAVEVTTRTPGSHAVGPVPTDGGSSSEGGSSGYVYPTLPADSPRLKDSTPAGPDTLWYDDGGGRSCIYIPDSTPACFTLSEDGEPGAGSITIDPAAMAAEAADRLPLLPGNVSASPARPRGGLTGVRSWFWLDPAPTTEQASVSEGPETVTVTAVPEIGWHFGDAAGATRNVPSYRPARIPDDAMGHSYETRCLPGDRDRNPYVLSTCGTDGYEVEATVTWTITYEATGPIVASGTLPTRTTSASATYPVGESRAFLTAAGAQP